MLENVVSSVYAMGSYANTSRCSRLKFPNIACLAMGDLRLLLKLWCAGALYLDHASVEGLPLSPWALQAASTEHSVPGRCRAVCQGPSGLHNQWSWSFNLRAIPPEPTGRRRLTRISVQPHSSYGNEPHVGCFHWSILTSKHFGDV